MRLSIKAGALAGFASFGLATSAFAGTYEAGGQTLTYEAFTPQTVDVTIATDKAGHKMNLIRLKNGHMMVLVPASVYMTLPPSANAFDMLN